MKYTCPCCGYLSFNSPPGSHEICTICFWEDDISQLRFALQSGGANKESLIVSQKNFEEMGSIERRFVTQTRDPSDFDERDPEWRKIDLSKDNFEVPILGKDYGNSYPNDPTTLYYWEENYWKKIK